LIIDFVYPSKNFFDASNIRLKTNRYDSNMNIILGVYNGYESIKTEKGGLFYFMRSLRKYNNSCKVVVVCEKQNIFDELLKLSKAFDFEIFSDFNLQYNMMFYRFEIYKTYLSDKVYDKVLLTDMNDVIFQEDPFAFQFSGKMYFACEQGILGDFNDSSSVLNMIWLVGCSHIKQNYSLYNGKNIICAGTVLGTYTGVMEYLDFYVSNQREKIVNDQGLLNVYVYNYINEKNILPYQESKILTLDKIKFEDLTLNENNNIVNKLGEKYSIIHQIDRCNLSFMLMLAES